MNQLKQKATRGVAWVAVGNWGSQITSFLVFLVLTRLIGPEAFGLVGMATVFTAFVGLFAEQGLGQAIVQRQDLEEAHLNTAFWTNVGIGSALTLLGFFLSPIVARLYNEPRLSSIVALLSINFLFTSLSSTQQAIFERRLDFRALSTRRLLAALAGGITAIIMAILGVGVYALVINSLLNGLVGVLLLWKLSDWRPKFTYSKSHFKELFYFGANMVGFRITSFFLTRLDDFLIGYFLGPTVLGYYVVAYHLARVTLEMFTSLIGRVAITTFARLQDNLFKLRQAFIKTTKIVILITFPIFTGMILLAYELIVFFSGEQWLPSVRPMQILSIAGFPLTMQFIVSYLIVATGRPELIFRMGIVVTVVAAIAFALSAPFGIYYVSISYTAVNFFFFLAYLLLGHRIIEIDLKIYFFQMLWPLIACIIMAIAILLLKNNSHYQDIYLWLRLLTAIGLGIIVYFISIFLLQRSVISEFFDAFLDILPARFNLRKRIQELF